MRADVRLAVIGLAIIFMAWGLVGYAVVHFVLKLW